jgi:hypothetical protein
MRNKIWKSILVLAVVVLGATVILRTIARARPDPPDMGDEEEAIKTPTRVSIQKGKVVVKLSSETQSLVGISTALLAAAREQEQITAPAVVLSVQDLVNLSASYAAGQATLLKAENDLGVSRREYERLRNLFTDHQNVSAKTFQAAEGLFHNDQTDVAKARQNLEYQAAALQQSWGAEVAKWVAGNSSNLQRILSRQEVLVQVTLPPGEIPDAPPTISLELPGGGRAKASLVSAFPRVDPRIQGSSYLYKTPARSVLAPGLNLVAYLSFGPRLQGVVVPSSAIVWWQGDAWIYEQTAVGEFTRRPVSTDQPVAGGFFVTKGLSPGEKIVLTGAQALLSEEFRSQIQPEE